MKRQHRITIAVAAMYSVLTAASASAENIDLNAEIIKRLEKSGKLNELYKQKTGRDRPKVVAASAIFTGIVGGKGLKLSLPGVAASRPSVVDQLEVDNCFSESLSQEIRVGGRTTNTTSFENMDQIETGQSYTVSMTYESPWGVSATASTTQDKRSISMTKQGASETSEKDWSFTSTVPVKPNTGLTAQLVVTEQKLAAVPYTANFVLDGSVKLIYSAGAAGFSWVERRGGSLPKTPYPPMQIGKQWDYALYVCRVKQGDKVFFGKTHGAVCYLGSEGRGSGIMSVPPGWRSEAYEFLVGEQTAVSYGDPQAGNAFDGSTNNSNKQVCIGDIGGGLKLPGFVTGDGQCATHHDQWTRLTRNYQVLLDPRVGGVEVDVKLADILSEADRTFNLRGVFNGVQAVTGKMVTKPRKVVCEDEPQMAAASSARAQSVGGLGGGPTKRLKVKRAAPGTPITDGNVVAGQ